MEARHTAIRVAIEAPVFIHGAQGCGKTRHAQALAKHYGKTLVMDVEEAGLHAPCPDHAIVFTNVELPGSIPFKDAMRAAGIDMREPYEGLQSSAAKRRSSSKSSLASVDSSENTVATTAACFSASPNKV